MKKTTINILCVLIICIITASAAIPFYSVTTTFIAGVKAGTTSAEAGVEEIGVIPLDMAFNQRAEDFYLPGDTLRLDDGTKAPMIISKATVFLPSDRFNMKAIATSMAISFVGVVLSVLSLIEFIRFIVNINRGEIFVMANVRRLRRLSFYMLAIALLQCVSGIIDDLMLSYGGMSHSGYSLTSYWTIPWTTMTLGLLALLMAEIWRRGISLQEEQELTI